MDPSAPGQPFGRYRLHALLGRGGMGEVYLATGPGVAGVEKRLAIKRILPALVDDPAFVARFLDEARLVVQLSHGNIVPVFEAGQVGRDYFLAMELVDGHNLREVLRAATAAGERLPISLAVLVAHEVARGLDYAHRKTSVDGRALGIIHRDVSPQNVLLGFDGEVRLVDFGIAKATGRSQQTHTGGLLGKFGYMSPEQALGLPLDGRSDLFALGAVLYELLTGAALFDGETDPEVLRKVQEARVPPPSTLRPEVPPELDALVLRMLARDPGERFGSASELEKRLGVLRYASGAGPTELSALLTRLLGTRRAPAELLLGGPEALPAPRDSTATLQPEAPSPSRRSGVAARIAVPLLVLALPVAAALGHWLPRPAAISPVPSTKVELAAALPPPVVEAPKAPVAVAPTPVVAVPIAIAPAPAPIEPPAPTPAPVRHPASHPRVVKPAEPPPAAPTAATGSLSLRVNPWGDIEIDGASVGQTAALVRHALTAGKHQVRVSNPALGRESRFDVDILSGKDLVQRVDLTR